MIPTETPPTLGALRLLIDPAQSGAVNMATDEAILTAVNGATAPATLRFYQWSAPTLSLGYFQQHIAVAEQDQAVAALPVVRRQTGGGAILHDQELTYSLILPMYIPLAAGIEEMYRLVHDAFIEGLAIFGVQVAYRGGVDRGNAQRGPFFCFARTHRLDLVVGTGKILGSAQRRIKNAVLQHGSLILHRRFPQQPAAEAGALDMAALIEHVSAAVAGGLQLSRQQGELTAVEQNLRDELVAKYAGCEWNQQR